MGVGNQMKRKCLAVGIILLFVGTSIIPAMAQKTAKSLPTSQGNNIYVDDDNTEGPWDGTLEHPFQHIMDAVGALADEDTIFVFNGMYNEDINLRYFEDLNFTLTGENKVSTIINGTVDVRYTTIRFRINDFSIREYLLIGAFGWTNDIIVEDNIFVNGGIIIDDSYGNIIKNNTFYTKPILLMYTKNNVISNNTFYSGGILFGSFYGKYNWDSHTIENNTINNKPIRYYKNTSGVIVREDTGQLILAGCDNCTVQNLDISNVDSGIQMAYSSSNHIVNCQIHNGSSNATDNLFYYAGIKCHISNYNTIEYTTITKFNYGIKCSQTKYNSISHCSISHCDKGIDLSISSYEEISQNNISYNNQGIDCTYDPYNINIKGNVITHNAEGILFGNNAGIGHSNITMNSFISNENGLSIFLCFFISVKCNNFINNKRDAYFVFSVTSWWRNYWEQPRILPHVIVGRSLKYLILDAIYILLWLRYPDNHFPEPPAPKEIIWFNIDWRPALKPYDIPGLS